MLLLNSFLLTSCWGKFCYRNFILLGFLDPQGLFLVSISVSHSFIHPSFAGLKFSKVWTKQGWCSCCWAICSILQEKSCFNLVPRNKTVSIQSKITISKVKQELTKKSAPTIAKNTVKTWKFAVIYNFIYWIIMYNPQRNIQYSKI